MPHRQADFRMPHCLLCGSRCNPGGIQQTGKRVPKRMNVKRSPPFVRFRNAGGTQIPVENNNQPARNVEQRFVEPVLPGVGVQLQAFPPNKRPATVGKPIPQIVRKVAPQRNVGTNNSSSAILSGVFRNAARPRLNDSRNVENDSGSFVQVFRLAGLTGSVGSVCSVVCFTGFAVFRPYSATGRNCTATSNRASSSGVIARRIRFCPVDSSSRSASATGFERRRFSETAQLQNAFNADK